MAVYHVPKPGFIEWLSDLGSRSVFIPEAKPPGRERPQAGTSRTGAAWVRQLAGQEQQTPALDLPRASQSCKGFLLPAAETVAKYGRAAGQPVAVAEAEIVLVGVRACELRAFAYLDKVMLEGEFVEPLYKARRESAIVVSCDCVDCAETCHCVLVGGRPYAEEGSDVNVTPLDDAFLVEPLSDKGRELLASKSRDWAEATDEHLDRRRQLREAMVERLEKQNAEFTLGATDENPPALPEADEESWQRFAADCVECGACTNICPTCHCFYLFDHAVAADSAERVRTWDSCLLGTYHRMAGGAGMKLTPRPELRSRLANRILHKFVYSPQQYGVLGCVGCGRCIDACLGAIDIRKVVEDLKQ